MKILCKHAHTYLYFRIVEQIVRVGHFELSKNTTVYAGLDPNNKFATTVQLVSSRRYKTTSIPISVEEWSEFIKSFDNNLVTIQIQASSQSSSESCSISSGKAKRPRKSPSSKKSKKCSLIFKETHIGEKIKLYNETNGKRFFGCVEYGLPDEIDVVPKVIRLDTNELCQLQKCMDAVTFRLQTLQQLDFFSFYNDILCTALRDDVQRSIEATNSTLMALSKGICEPTIRSTYTDNLHIMYDILLHFVDRVKLDIGYHLLFRDIPNL